MIGADRAGMRAQCFREPQSAMDRDLRDRYSAVGQIIHWVTAVLVLIAFIYGPGGSETRVYAPGRDFERGLHETLGLTVLGLAVLRLLWRISARTPDPPDVARWMGLLAKATQAALYVLLFAVPLTAITGAWLEGHPLTLLAGVRLMPLVSESHAVGAAVAKIHGWLGDAILWLAGLHAAAALFHHFALRDGVLVSMLPRWFARPR
jgi:cytochrome b561